MGFRYQESVSIFVPLIVYYPKQVLRCGDKKHMRIKVRFLGGRTWGHESRHMPPKIKIWEPSQYSDHPRLTSRHCGCSTQYLKRNNGQPGRLFEFLSAQNILNYMQTNCMINDIFRLKMNCLFSCRYMTTVDATLIFVNDFLTSYKCCLR